MSIYPNAEKSKIARSELGKNMYLTSLFQCQKGQCPLKSNFRLLRFFYEKNDAFVVIEL